MELVPLACEDASIYMMDLPDFTVCSFMEISIDLKRVILFDLILYVPSTIFQLNRDESPWVEPVLS